jgi:hypothetical protein
MKNMIRTIKHIGLGAAFAALLVTTANAQVSYYWVANSLSPGVTSGTGDYLQITGGTTVTGYSFNDGATGTYTSANSTFSGILTFAGDGDPQLIGEFIPNGFPHGAIGSVLTWNIPDPHGIGTPATGPIENVATDGNASYGDWAPVPEPSTIIAGALLLMPFGATTLRRLRQNLRA